MKFTGFAVSFALVGAVSAAALPAVPGGAAIDNLEGTLGKVTGAAIKRDETDALTGAIYGTTESLNGVTGIAGSVAGTAESTTSGAVGTVEAEVAGIVPAKRQLDGVTAPLKGVLGGAGIKRQLGSTEGALGGVEGAAEGLLAGASTAVKRGETDAVSGATYGITSNLNGVTGIAGSVAGTAESTTSGAVGTVEAEVAGIVPAKRQLDSVTGAAQGVTSGAGVKRDETDALTGAIYGTTESLNGVTGIAGSLAGTAESTTSGAVGTVEAEVAGVVPAKRQLPGLGNVVSASLANDLGMLSGNPSGLIGALGGLQAALSSGGILPSQIATMPAELQHVVALIYTE